jgi:hypothetical protein
MQMLHDLLHVVVVVVGQLGDGGAFEPRDVGVHLDSDGRGRAVHRLGEVAPYLPLAIVVEPRSHHGSGTPVKGV